MKVTLNEHELWLGAMIGMKRNIESIVKGQEHYPPLSKKICEKCGHKASGWHNHIEGCCAEVAAAKGTDRFWAATFNTYTGAADLGKWEVRWSNRPYRGIYSWPIRKKDKDDSIFIFVRGEAPTYELMGWEVAGVVKQDKYLRDPGGRGAAWFIPHTDLRPIEDLIE